MSELIFYATYHPNQVYIEINDMRLRGLRNYGGWRSDVAQTLNNTV